MLTKELIQKIRHIEIKSKQLVEETFSGSYHARFKGKGMSFEDIRAYSPGDDVRAIDWNVTARQNSPYVKQFTEEREMTLFLLIDMSGSGAFGDKRERIAELGAALSYSANKNNDRVGTILFTDRVEKVIPAMGGKRHILSIIETILTFEPKGSGTDIQKALAYFAKIQKKRSILLVISDFMDEGYEKTLKALGRKHDVIPIQVLDRAEITLPKGAIFSLTDLETGQQMMVDNLKGHQALAPKPPGPGAVTLYTDEDYVKILRHYFLRKVRR